MCPESVDKSYRVMAILGDLSVSTWSSLEEIECNSFLVAQRKNYASTYLKNNLPYDKHLFRRVHLASKRGHSMERCKEKRAER